MSPGAPRRPNAASVPAGRPIGPTTAYGKHTHVFPVEQPRGVVLAGHLRYVTRLIKASAVRRIGFLLAPTKPPAARLICRADVARADAYKTGAYRYFSGTRVRPHVEIQAHRGPPTAPPFVEKGERKGIHATLGTIPRRQRHTHPLRSMYTPLPLRNRLSTCCLRTVGITRIASSVSIIRIGIIVHLG